MKTVRSIALLLMVGIIMFGACACMGKEKVNYSDEAYNYAKEFLQKKYDKEFEIENLERKDSGIFRTKEYIGVAYPIDSKDDKFTVWVNPKEKTVVDSFECIRINDVANSWILERAVEVWPRADAKMETLLASVPTVELTIYNSENIEEYFIKEFSDNKIFVSIPDFSNDETETLNIINFLKKTECVTNGLLYLNYSNEKEDLIVSLAADEEAIKNAIAKWRD